jgi:hypothetical protein
MPLARFGDARCPAVERRRGVARSLHSSLRRCLVAERAMRSPVVIFPAPAGNDHACFREASKDLFVEACISPRAKETLCLPILPRMPRGDGHCLAPALGQPALQRWCEQFRPLVTAHVLGSPMRGQQPLQRRDPCTGRPAPLHTDGQMLACVLIEHDQELHCMPSFGAVEQAVLVLSQTRYSGKS